MHCLLDISCYYNFVSVFSFLKSATSYASLRVHACSNPCFIRILFAAQIKGHDWKRNLSCQGGKEIAEDRANLNRSIARRPGLQASVAILLQFKPRPVR